MHSKIIQEFSNNLLRYQKDIGFDTFTGLSDGALKKINLLAIDKLTLDMTLEYLGLYLKFKKIKRKKGCSLSTQLALYVIIVAFHSFLLYRKYFVRENINIKNSNIIFFGSRNSTIRKGYEYLCSLYPNSTFLALIGKGDISNRNNKNLFIGFEANFDSMLHSIKFVHKYVPLFGYIDFIGQQKIKKVCSFFFEYIKIFYSIEKSKLIQNITPSNSINIFMCDNNFFHTVHIDLLNRKNYDTVVLQHGSFLAGNIVYLPVLAKWILSCSLREAKLFEKSSPNLKVSILGAPLQVCCNLNQISIKSNSGEDKQYDLLILGRDGDLWEIENAYKILIGLSKNLNSNSVLIRHHPKCNTQRKELLENAINTSDISNSKSIIEDIKRAKIIVSFSVDSNIFSLLMKKKTIFCGEPDAEELEMFSNILPNFKVARTAEELITYIQYFSQNDFNEIEGYDEKMTSNFGEFSMEIIKRNYINFIDNVIQSRNSLQLI